MKLDRTSMLYGTLILTGTSIVSQFLGFVYRILLSRLIGAEVMGLYQLIMPVFSVIMALTAVGLTVAVSNLSSQYHARGNRAAIAQVLRRCLAVFLLLFAAVAAVVVLLYDPISVYLLGDARTQLGLLLLLPCILLTGVENLHKHFFYGTGNIRPPAAVELCEQFIRTGAVLGLLVVFLPQNPERTVGLIVTGMILCELFSAVTLLLLARRHLNRAGGLTGAPLEHRQLNRRIASIAVPIGLTSLLGNLMGSATSVLIPQRLVHAGAEVSEAMSAFGVLCGMTLPMLCLPTAFIGALGLVLVPKLAEGAALGQRGLVQHRVDRSMLATSVLILPAMAFLVVLGPTLGAALFREPTVGRSILPLSVGVLLSCYQSVPQRRGPSGGRRPQLHPLRRGAARLYLLPHGPARRGTQGLCGGLSRLRRPGGTPQLVGRPPGHRPAGPDFSVVHRPRPLRPAHGAGDQPSVPGAPPRRPGGSPRRPGLPAVRRRALPGRPPGSGHPPAPPVPPVLKPLCKRPAPCYDGVKLKKGADVWEFGLESSARAPRWPSPTGMWRAFWPRRGAVPSPPCAAAPWRAAGGCASGTGLTGYG